jgi:uncharacterized protein YndB with AHSA1/START domain
MHRRRTRSPAALDTLEHRYTIKWVAAEICFLSRWRHRDDVVYCRGIVMPKVLVSTVINAPIERVWRTVADYNGLPAWMPGMRESMIEDGKKPTEVGAVRRLAMAGSKEILRERLEVFDPDNHTITYSVLQGPLPVENIRTTLHLRPITDTYGTLGEWSTQFDTKSGEEEEGQQFMARVFNAGFRAMKKHLGV